ncbi:MAG: hypothetical protein EZS28_016657 [Streblomastix strix]|uniref:Uncharacterized protein n=1 Tax=Streblomastix strix TaxID=222440 RepID=A0A5J4VZX6_9EUKA|nr:MAG: hypothetical protein EZS28_016657 [Streblomastix strix]
MKEKHQRKSLQRQNNVPPKILPPIFIIEHYRISGVGTDIPYYANDRVAGGPEGPQTTLSSSGASDEMSEKSISGAS